MNPVFDKFNLSRLSSATTLTRTLGDFFGRVYCFRGAGKKVFLAFSNWHVIGSMFEQNQVRRQQFLIFVASFLQLNIKLYGFITFSFSKNVLETFFSSGTI